MKAFDFKLWTLLQAVKMQVTPKGVPFDWGDILAKQFQFSDTREECTLIGHYPRAADLFRDFAVKNGAERMLVGKNRMPTCCGLIMSSSFE